jgi:hypothetical protein
VVERELVRDVEQGALVVPEQGGLQELATPLEYQGEGDDGGPLVVLGGGPTAEQRDRVRDLAGDAPVGAGQRAFDEIGAGVIDDVHEPSDVLAVLGQPQLDAAGFQQCVDLPPVQRPADIGGEVAVVPAALVPAVVAADTEAGDEVMEALSSCLPMRVSGAALGRDGVAVALWSGGCGGQSGDLVPGGESGGHLVAVLDCGESVTVGPKVR